MTSPSSGAPPAAPGSELAGFLSSVGQDRRLRVEESLGQGFVRLRVAEAERRQAKHDIRCVEDAVIEMLRNSRDAGAASVYVATARDGALRTTTVLDDGTGIPPALHELVFDARVTSKLETMREDRWGVHGRGMALYSIRENACEATVMSSDVGKGAALRIVTDAARLAERADQSTWPTLGSDDEGAEALVRGPHNIVRACCEFALAERAGCKVFVGTPAEIVATACRHARPRMDVASLIRLETLDALPVLERLAAAADAAELAEVAATLGLALSERTAHRILAGEIKPLPSAYARLARRDASRRRAVDLARDRRGLCLSPADARQFAEMMGRDFAFLADRYYLRLVGEPRIRVGSGRLTVTFDVEDGD